MLFNNRKQAGTKLADALDKFKDEQVVVFALPRGGVVLGVEIAKKLHAPLDLVITKKIGHPMNPEYAICAVAEEGEPLCNPSEVARIDSGWLDSEVERIRQEIKRRRQHYFGKIKQQNIEGKTAIIVDDGIATGFTMMAAIKEITMRKPKQVVVAVPVTPYDTAKKLKSMADELVSLYIERHYLGAVGAYYIDFRQVEDNEVMALLKSVNNAP